MSQSTAARPEAAAAPSRTIHGSVGGESGGRVAAIDRMRGAVMVLMAIDHVRVYSGLPPGGPTPGIFFTRWVTHFCAPAFVFLAGTSAYLYARRHPMGNPPAPPGYAWGFGTLYAVWLLAIVLLFFPCRWFAGWKSRSASPWLRFF